MVFAFDLEAVLALQRMALASPLAHDCAVFCARWSIFLNIPLAVWLLVSKKKDQIHAVYEAAWTLAISAAIVAFVSRVVHRPRPFLASPWVTALIPPPYNTSFPSGHTAAAISIALAFSLADSRIGAISFVIAGMTAFGRMSAGVHYPTDILGGAAVGLIAFYIVRQGHVSMRSRDIRRSVAHHRHDA